MIGDDIPLPRKKLTRRTRDLYVCHFAVMGLKHNLHQIKEKPFTEGIPDRRVLGVISEGHAAVKKQCESYLSPGFREDLDEIETAVKEALEKSEGLSP